MARRPITGTYRLQLRPGFGFAEAAEVVPYLARLGVSHLYLSPVLQAVPGSTHGYDVVDHTTVSQELGGEAGLRRLAAVASEHDLGVVVDVVPNHMAVPMPATLNTKLWSVLRDGPVSPYARWFDVDWSVPDHALLMPVLGRRIGQCLAAGELRLDELDGEPVLRYFDNVFPVRPGTERLPLPELVERQWYRLAHWRVADEELNYRRFFDVDTLAAVRVEVPEVFAATHDLLVRLHEDGVVDGFRIDHPDGLADPRGYLAALAEATDGAWVVVEKILEGEEALPADWACAGSTGYDALNRVLHLLVDPAGAEPLLSLWSALTGASRDSASVVEAAKRQVLATSLRAEVNRLVELAHGICSRDVTLRDVTRGRLHGAIVEMLVAFDRYRAYVVPGEPADDEAVALVEHAVRVALERRAELEDEVAILRDLALGRLGSDPRRDEWCVRFQQTCGPAMAKGVEDTAWYRYLPLAALCEVGGWVLPMGCLPEGSDPVAALHTWAEHQQRTAPEGMTTLSTHDTKRSEDVRARLAVLSEDPAAWGRTVTAWRAAAAPWRAPELDAGTEYLVWQTLVGVWPLSADRLLPYLEKATREAKVHTSWTDPDETYDRAVRAFAEGVLGDDELPGAVEAYVDGLAPAFRSNVLAQKLLQLVLPGVPDCYQGCEEVDLSLVDPDNRRPVAYTARAARLAALDAGTAAGDLDAEKLLVTSAALRLRREHSEWFGTDGGYAALATGTPHAVGLLRGQGRVAAVVTRHPVGLERAGGFGASTVSLPEGAWRDLLTGRAVPGGDVALAALLDPLPVSLLARE